MGGPQAHGELIRRSVCCCMQRQGRTHSYRSYSPMGQSGARSMDGGRRGNRGKNLPGRRQNGQDMGPRYLAKCGVVCSPHLLRASGFGKHCSTRLVPNLCQAMPQQRWGAGADSVLAGACIRANHRTLSWLQTESRTPRERSFSPQHARFAAAIPCRIWRGERAHSSSDGVSPSDRMPPRRIGI
jgi:hypothetical protein